ncbi:hypothetical protein EDB89DRAFT_2064219 [Lactarius sanguifluus]|nr:hypothetical protein EDB89DRAFT_2064219 [Lactarius sanguifluus]
MQNLPSLQPPAKEARTPQVPGKAEEALRTLLKMQNLPVSHLAFHLVLLQAVQFSSRKTDVPFHFAPLQEVQFSLCAIARSAILPSRHCKKSSLPFTSLQEEQSPLHLTARRAVSPSRHCKKCSSHPANKCAVPLHVTTRSAVFPSRHCKKCNSPFATLQEEQSPLRVTARSAVFHFVSLQEVQSSSRKNDVPFHFMSLQKKCSPHSATHTKDASPLPAKDAVPSKTNPGKANNASPLPANDAVPSYAP